jgi:hypothetical protein
LSGFYNKFQADSKIKLTSHTPKGFDEAVRNYAQEVGKPIFLIDEADRALTANTRQGERLIRVCRALTKSGDCTFIFFGSATLAALCSNAKSDLFNFATSMPLGYLSKDVTHKVLLDPMEKIDVFLDDPDYITDKVFEITSGHPNLVQKIGSLLINKANKNHRRITRQHIDQICSDSSFRDYFLDIIWGVSGSLEKLITLTAPALDFTLSEIIDALVKRGIRFRKITEKAPSTEEIVLTYNRLNSALRMLRDLSILSEDADGYHFIPRSFQSLLKLKNPQVVENDIDACLFELSKQARDS